MLNVMIVDDSSLIRKVFAKNLEEMGFKVVGTANNGKDAITKYDELKPDLVTMDITMPIMTGIDSLKALKSKDKDVKVIMVTSHGEERLVMEAISLGAKGYILKPITPEKVKEVIHKVFPELKDVENLL